MVHFVCVNNHQAQVDIRTGGRASGGIECRLGGQPVSGAMVTIGGQSVATNGQGQFSVFVDPGQQQLRVTASGMVDFTQSVNVTPDQQLGQLTMTSVPDSTGQNSASATEEGMTPFLLIGLLGALGEFILVIAVVRKRRG